MKRRFEFERIRSARPENIYLRRREPTALEHIEAVCERLNPGLTALALVLGVACVMLATCRVAQVMDIASIDGFVVSESIFQSP